MSAQEELWRLLDVIGPWLWIIKPALCAVAFAILLWRAPPVCWLERVARFACFLGLVGIVMALLNSALGPLGDVLFFGGYVLTLIHRRTVEVRRGEVRPSPSMGARQ